MRRRQSGFHIRVDFPRFHFSTSRRRFSGVWLAWPCWRCVYGRIFAILLLLQSAKRPRSKPNDWPQPEEDNFHTDGTLSDDGDDDDGRDDDRGDGDVHERRFRLGRRAQPSAISVVSSIVVSFTPRNAPLNEIISSRLFSFLPKASPRNLSAVFCQQTQTFTHRNRKC